MNSKEKWLDQAEHWYMKPGPVRSNTAAMIARTHAILAVQMLGKDGE